MRNDLELNEDGSVSIPGMRRGRPPGYSPKKARDREAADGADLGEDPTDRTSLAMRKALALVEKEEALAKSAALKFEIDSGNYLAREAFRQASATLIAEVTQALRSLPDLLERKCALQPDQLVKVEEVIDETLNTLADGLMLFTEQAPPN